MFTTYVPTINLICKVRVHNGYTNITSKILYTQWYKMGFPRTRSGFESHWGENPFASAPPLYVPLVTIIYYSLGESVL